MEGTEFPPLCVEGGLGDVLDAVEVSHNAEDPACDFVGVDVVSCVGEAVPDLVFLVTTAW